VDTFTRIVNSLLQLLTQLGDLAVSGLKAIELWLRDQLTSLGVPPELQTIIMLALAALLVLLVVRAFGGLIRVVVLLVLLLVAVRVLLPVLPH
jgi:hypothetical protein